MLHVERASFRARRPAGICERDVISHLRTIRSRDAHSRLHVRLAIRGANLCVTPTDLYQKKTRSPSVDTNNSVKVARGGHAWTEWLLFPAYLGERASR